MAHIPSTTNGGDKAAFVNNPVSNATWQQLGVQRLLDNNQIWAQSTTATDPDFFSRLAHQQSPEYFWIGCADSRVPANQIVGLAPGEVFVQRNVGNQAHHSDLNCMACLEYAVTALGVKHIIVSGHYNCGAVRAAMVMPQKTEALVNYWIQGIRDVRDEHMEELAHIPDLTERVDRLCELNVLRQVFNVASSPVVQGAWDRGTPLAVHGFVYSVETGLIKALHPPVNSLEELEEFASQHQQHKLLGRRVRNHVRSSLESNTSEVLCTQRHS